MRRPVCCCLLLSSVLVSAAETGEPNVLQYRLENGLTVLLRPIDGAEQVALITLYALGEDHDPEGRSGLGHLVEHLYVTAAAGNTQARTIREFMQRYPSAWNAQTGDRYTVIATVFPSASLDAELEDAAARIRDLRVTASDLDREKRRVIEELHNMFEALPRLAVRNRAREMVCPSPSGGRKGGVPQQVDRLTLDQVQARWQRYYKPANAMLVLAGKIEASSARAAIEKHFAPLAPGDPAPPPRAAGKPQVGTTRQVAVTSPRPNARSEVCLAYAAPSPADDRYAAFLVLVARLQTGAAKLQTGPAHFPVSYAPLDDPGVLFVTSPLQQGEDGDQAVARLDAFVSQTVEPPIRFTDAVLAKYLFGFLLGIKPQADTVLAQNVYGAAFGIGRRSQLGIDAIQLGKAIAAVDADQLRGARAIFEPGARAAVVVTVRPNR